MFFSISSDKIQFLSCDVLIKPYQGLILINDREIINITNYIKRPYIYDDCKKEGWVVSRKQKQQQQKNADECRC